MDMARSTGTQTRAWKVRGNRWLQAALLAGIAWLAGAGLFAQGPPLSPVLPLPPGEGPADHNGPAIEPGSPAAPKEDKAAPSDQAGAATGKAPPSPAPLPGLPPGFGMGGFPGPPEKVKDPQTIQDIIKNSLTVILRDGGVLRPYGFFRGDLDFATHRFNDLQNPFFVLPNEPRFRIGPNNVPVVPNDFNYSLYPRLTRAGLEYFGQPIPHFFDGVPTGRLEIDFLTLGPGGPESRELLRLRLAYAAIQVNEWTLLVGQDWDIVAPLIPTVNDNTNQWNNGNLGDRRPQVKLLWDHDLGGGCRVQVQNGIALADAINSIDLDGNGLRDQEDFGIPGYEGRLGFVAPSPFCNQPVMGGVWAMWAREETDVPIAGRRHFASHGYGLDLRFPLAERLAFQCEAWHGRNLDDFRGGIAQGVNRLTGEGIEATGGWGELVYRPAPWYQVATGFSIDSPVRGDVPFGGRVLNYSWYLSHRFPLGSGLTIGSDYQLWTTEWQGFRQGRASLIKFFLAQAF